MESNATFGARLKAAREAAGLSQKDAEFELRSLLPEALWIDQSKISRLEKGAVAEEKADPYAIEWLCAIYGVEVAEVSEPIAANLRKARNELNKMRRTQGLRTSRWDADSGDWRLLAEAAHDSVLDLTDDAIARGTHPDCAPQTTYDRAA